MDNNGVFRVVHGDLDPRAQEFIPHQSFLPLQWHSQFHCPPPPLPPPAYISNNPPMPTPCLPPPSSMPTRTLLLSMVPLEVSESIIRRDLEVFGDVRAVQMERIREGIVTVHFYDLRQAQTALREIQEQNMQQQYRLRRHYEEFGPNNSFGFVFLPPLPPPARGLVAGRVVWAQFTYPAISGLPGGNNQGTLVVFNLSLNTSSNTLRDIFQAYGQVKELRETPMKKHQKFVEFYDVRDAARALMEMNGKEISGQNLVIEFSRPGGNNNRRFSKVSQFTSSSSKFSNYNYTSSPSNPPKRRPHLVYPKSSYSGSESSSGAGSIQDSMATLCIISKLGPEKVKCDGKSAASVVQVKNIRPWKGGSSKQANKDYDPRFLINEDAIMESNCGDARTTVMIKNIPNKYSQKLLLNMLDNHCIHCNEQIAAGDDQNPKSSYDFVYLPIDFINKCNVGYGFVNMTSPQATLRLYKAFHHQNWEVFNSRKICQVTYARLQGIEALKEHFKNSKFPSEAKEYMPVIFTPPRDGILLTEPLPIVGLDDDALNINKS